MNFGDRGERGAIGVCPRCGKCDGISWNPLTDISECVCGWDNSGDPYPDCCTVCSDDYNQKIVSILVRYHTSDIQTNTIVKTIFCPNCGRRLDK